jgi:hypothetical protein
MGYFEDKSPDCVVSVLGTDYRIFLDVPESADDILKTCFGYCDKTAHLIAVGEKSQDANLIDWQAYARQVLRHELIHAFLFESGLGGDSVWYVSGQEHPEQTVDWIARQFPKMLKAFQQVGAL